MWERRPRALFQANQHITLSNWGMQVGASWYNQPYVQQISYPAFSGKDQQTWSWTSIDDRFNDQSIQPTNSAFAAQDPEQVRESVQYNPMYETSLPEPVTKDDRQASERLRSAPIPNVAQNNKTSAPNSSNPFLEEALRAMKEKANQDKEGIYEEIPARPHSAPPILSSEPPQVRNSDSRLSLSDHPALNKDKNSTRAESDSKIHSSSKRNPKSDPLPPRPNLAFSPPTESDAKIVEDDIYLEPVSNSYVTFSKSSSVKQSHRDSKNDPLPEIPKESNLSQRQTFSTENVYEEIGERSDSSKKPEQGFVSKVVKVFDTVKSFFSGKKTEITPLPSKEELERPWNRKDNEPVYQEAIAKTSQFSHDSLTYESVYEEPLRTTVEASHTSYDDPTYGNVTNQAANHTYENLPEKKHETVFYKNTETTTSHQLDESNQKRLQGALESKEFRAVASSLSEHPLSQKGLQNASKVTSPGESPPVQNEGQKSSKAHG